MMNELRIPALADLYDSFQHAAPDEDSCNAHPRSLLRTNTGQCLG